MMCLLESNISGPLLNLEQAFVLANKAIMSWSKSYTIPKSIYLFWFEYTSMLSVQSRVVWCFEYFCNRDMHVV